jgi:carbonic anhydrase
MEKLFHFDCPQEVYTADACVITCFDARFDLAARKFLKRMGIATYDQVKIPGSAKSLAAPECEADRDFVLRAVRVSLRLHHANRVVIIAHNECGAYSGAPADMIAADAVKAASYLLSQEPGLAVECYFADFDGIYGIR